MLVRGGVTRCMDGMCARVPPQPCATPAQQLQLSQHGSASGGASASGTGHQGYSFTSPLLRHRNSPPPLHQRACTLLLPTGNTPAHPLRARAFACPGRLRGTQAPCPPSRGPCLHVGGWCLCSMQQACACRACVHTYALAAPILIILCGPHSCGMGPPYLRACSESRLRTLPFTRQAKALTQTALTAPA